jgi:hypothetical protein
VQPPPPPAPSTPPSCISPRTPVTGLTQGYDEESLQQAVDKTNREQAMGAHPLACVAVALLVAAQAATQHVMSLLLLHTSSRPDAQAALPSVAAVYVTLLPIAAISFSGIICDRHFNRRTSYSLSHACAVHYKQTSHVTLAAAFISFGSALALLLLHHPLSPAHQSLHTAVSHALLVLRTLASSCIITPTIASVSRLTAPYALPMSFATILLGEIAVYLLQLGCSCCGAICSAALYTVWGCLGVAAIELLVCCCMLILERYIAVASQIRVQGHEMQRRGRQVKRTRV